MGEVGYVRILWLWEWNRWFWFGENGRGEEGVGGVGWWSRVGFGVYMLFWYNHLTRRERELEEVLVGVVRYNTRKS